MPKVLPHEYAFNALLAYIALRVSLVAGPLDPHAIGFFAYAAVGLLLIPWCEQRPTTRRWRARLLWYPTIMGLSFFTLNSAIWTLGPADADPLLARWDVALLGAPATAYFAPIESKWLNDVMMAFYLFFFYYLVFGPFHYWRHDLRRFRNCFVGLFVLYAIGFLGYSLLPAGGPHWNPALKPLDGGPLLDYMHPLINAGSNQVDVFPSIHAAASLYLLIFDFSNYRQRFWILLVPTLGLWVSTVYLRYHYAVDLVAALAVTLLAVAVQHGYERSKLAATLDAELAATST
jgi:hypothetical protein